MHLERLFCSYLKERERENMLIDERKTWTFQILQKSSQVTGTRADGKLFHLQIRNADWKELNHSAESVVSVETFHRNMVGFLSTCWPVWFLGSLPGLRSFKPGTPCAPQPQTPFPFPPFPAFHGYFIFFLEIVWMPSELPAVTHFTVPQSNSPTNRDRC